MERRGFPIGVFRHVGRVLSGIIDSAVKISDIWIGDAKEERPSHDQVGTVQI